MYNNKVWSMYNNKVWKRNCPVCQLLCSCSLFMVVLTTRPICAVVVLSLWCSFCPPTYHKHVLPYHCFGISAEHYALYIHLVIICVSVHICIHFCLSSLLPALPICARLSLFVCSSLSRCACMSSHLTPLSLYHYAAVSLPPHRLPHHAGAAQVSSGQVPPACREVSRPLRLLHY